MLIWANGEDILIERIHPAYIIADNTPKENPKLSGKEHMQSVQLSKEEQLEAQGKKTPRIPESVHWVPMSVKPTSQKPNPNAQTQTQVSNQNQNQMQKPSSQNQNPQR